MPTPCINFPALDSLQVKSFPFTHVKHDQQIFHSSTLQSLAESFPEIRKAGYRNSHSSPKNTQWQDFLDELYSNRYRSSLEELFQISLKHTQVIIGLRKKCGISEGRPHRDDLRKVITHLIYLNEDWPAGKQNGNLLLLRGRNLQTEADEISAQLGNGLIFRVNRHSYHGFHPFQGIRKVVQVNFYLPVYRIFTLWKKHYS